MKKTLLSSLVLAASTFSMSAASAECDGNLYTMNAGRGDVGVLVNVHEGLARSITRKEFHMEAANLAEINSRALFSASAMAYDAANNRIYYASTPTPDEFYIDGVEEGGFSEEEITDLPFQSKKYQPYELAYFDVDSQTHHLVGTTPYQVWRMTFDPETGTLYGSDIRRLFTIDAATGESTLIGNLDLNIRLGGYANWGDLIFKDDELLFVTNTRVFSVSTENASASVKFFHYIDNITAATLDQNGEILVAAQNGNVTGSQNSTNLWVLDPTTNDKNFGSQSHAGLVPMRIDAMTRVTAETDTCYAPKFLPN
ncbi:hypothetical protein GCE9029_02559 [Grimontia celer]|uniref:SMP-30/Gluconolaconase/LRE-like region n=1 Tax=Grimontia celer TaxID=1796497 RepID=A0A128F4I4_9GAMM|nr:hypothetical protein [Grimontia celer]CZF81360.1 hypothetical protein GCE9029_02559 [Grimontia celer]